MSIQHQHPAPPVRQTGPAVLLALLAAFSPSSAAAQTMDPHALYESRCAACHQPHARDLAQSALALQGGTIVIKSSGAPLRLFLERHPRGLPPAEADALDRHFNAMLQTGFLYEKKCVACHERASTLARLRLFERDGVLEGRYSHRDITTFLRNHGRLTAMEVETIMNMFHRQLAPVVKP